MPTAILIAGCNGAGKTTFARQYLPATYPHAVFLNADEISRESERFGTAISAGRELLHRLEAVVVAGQPFAVETTLSSRAYATRIPRWKVSGYRVILHFIQLASADEACRRVAARVLAGGHDIPERDIVRRFERGNELFRSTYKDLADECYLWSSGAEGMSLEEELLPDE